MCPPNEPSSADVSSLVMPSRFSGSVTIAITDARGCRGKAREVGVFAQLQRGVSAGEKSERRQNIELVVSGAEAQYSEK